MRERQVRHTRKARDVGFAALIAGVVISTGTLDAGAADYSDPTWPCIQRKQPRLSPGAMWAGPPLPDQAGAWKDDAEVARLVPALAVRRTAMEEADDAIARFSEGLGAEVNARLTLLFQGLFETIDRERSEIIGGIARYAERQEGLEAALDQTRQEVSALTATAKPDDYDALDRIDELNDKLTWETRVFQERQQSLTYVCESPVLLEQRIFALARTIQNHLD